MNLKHYGLPLTAVLIWSANAVVSKLAAGVIAPSAISFYRWLLAGLLMASVLLKPVWHQRRAILPYLPKLFVLGLLGMVMYQCLAYIAAETTTATNMGILASLMPLLAVGLSVLLLGEVPTVGGIAGGVLSLLGLGYLLSHGNPASLLAHGVTTGDGLMLLACLSYAAYGVLLKRWALPLNNWHSLFVQIWCANLVLFVYYLTQSAPPITTGGLPLVLFAGIPASVIAPFLWMHGVAQLGPSRTTTLMNLLPVFTVAIAMLFLGETLHAYHVIGGSITLLGVVLAQKLKQPLRRRVALA
ncbi:DMT family transporter [Crenobacter sp. SG2303]|uniref:DMT family transporter n=1 Tax=Crenobacter oryzisoli TaxID=3056844 RepID=A0ABT7XUC2_9NEIS|nr:MULTISPECIES: DMT family transporter [unclassified Crenobacter]MDN0077397.1 DMT family transporter [Crenobacter sp. SG2303]MDN0085473.1 DMT family transporter [Crenobacter sp. SG2305]